MRKFTIALAFLTFVGVTLFASPAYRFKKMVKQSDGTTITVIKAGHEHFSYYMTEDGVPVVRHSDGDYHYAMVSRKGVLESTGHIAHNRLMRNVAEQTLSENYKTNFMERLEESALSQRYSIGTIDDVSVKSIGSPRIPILLVQFSDVKFANFDTLTFACDIPFFEKHFNASNYTDEGGSGSVRDYFIAQSDSLFQPSFDILGPVTLENPMSYYGGNSQGEDSCDTKMVQHACSLAVRQGIDFTPYMIKKNTIPFIGVIYAGYGEQASDFEDAIWAKYKSKLYYSVNDSRNNQTITFESALVTNEIADYGDGINPDGIGTFCHEFSHALGLPDMYCSGFGLDYWDLMDYGQFWSNGTKPVGYSAYERHFMGWLPLDTLSFEKQKVSIAPLAGPTGTRAYYIANRNDATGNEYYILENRQRSPWYSEVFGYGMLVTHIDYDRAKWIDNKVNTTLSHPRISIIPADNVLTPSSKAEDASSYQGDPYPGLTNNTSLTDNSTPADKVYKGGYMHVSLNQIHTDNAGNIVFAFMADGLLSSPVELKTTEATDESLTFSWENVENAQSYVVSLTLGDEIVAIDTLTSTTTTFSSLESDKTYRLAVTAIAETYVDSEPAMTEGKTLLSGIGKLTKEWGDGEVEAYTTSGIFLGKASMSQWQRSTSLKSGVYIFRSEGKTRKAVVER